MKKNKTAKARLEGARPVCFDGKSSDDWLPANPIRAHSAAVPGMAGRRRRSSVNRIEKKIKKCQKHQNPCNAEFCHAHVFISRRIGPLRVRNHLLL
jgi:hypothetical protein